METIASIVNRMVDHGWTDSGPPPCADEVRAAAKSFPWKTSPGVDGVHVRQVSWLSDGVLTVLGKVYGIIAGSGIIPGPMAVVTNPLIPKPDGGRRPIGAYGAHLRLWQALYKRAASDWMRRFAELHPELAAAPHRSAVDPVWRTALSAQMIKEANPGQGRLQISAHLTHCRRSARSTRRCGLVYRFGWSGWRSRATRSRGTSGLGGCDRGAITPRGDRGRGHGRHVRGRGVYGLRPDCAGPH